MLVQHKFLLSNAAKSNFQTSCTRNSSSDNVNSQKGRSQVLLAHVLQCCRFVYDIWNVLWVWVIPVKRRGGKQGKKKKKKENKKEKEKKSPGASGWAAQPKLCSASLNMSLVQTQASLMFFNRNIWWNPMIGSSSALSCPTTILSIQLSGVGWWSCAVMLCCIFWKGRLCN